jgi:hypothetical protein
VKSIALSVLFLAALGCTQTTPAPVINAFGASPATITAGRSSTLSWDVNGATQISLDNGLGSQGGASTIVSPTVTTTYTLTATGVGGTATATAVVTVGSAANAPQITFFRASPNFIAIGATSTLSWATTGQVTTLAIDQSVGDVTGQTSKAVTVNQNTTYTLTAAGPGGTVTQTVSVSTHSPFLHLEYTDPVAPTAKLVLVKNPTASTNTRLVLDLKVGALAPVTAFGVALNLPFDPASTNMVAFTNSSAAGLGGVMPGVIQAGSGPATAGAFLGGPTLGNLFTVGVAKHKGAVGDGDDTWAPGATLFSLAFDLGPSAIAGTNVFQAAALAGNPKFRAAALHKDGTQSVAQADIALGDLVLSN